ASSETRRRRLAPPPARGRIQDDRRGGRRSSPNDNRLPRRYDVSHFGRTGARGAALALLAATALSVAAVPPRPALAEGQGVFHPETFTLANGLEVVVITNRRAPVVLHMMWYKAG